jgi:hypothetical protein
MFFSQTVRRDDEGAERDVIARALGAGRDSFDQRRMPTEGSEDDGPLRWLGPPASPIAPQTSRAISSRAKGHLLAGEYPAP